MAQEHTIRLGGVMCIYEVGKLLRLRGVHPPEAELIVCEADLPELIALLVQHSVRTAETTRLESKHDSVPVKHMSTKPTERGKEHPD